MMIGRGRCGVATVPWVHTVAEKYLVTIIIKNICAGHNIDCRVPGVVCGVGGVHGAVATRSMHLQSSVFTLLGDGVHLGEENRGDQHSTWDTKLFQ